MKQHRAGLPYLPRRHLPALHTLPRTAIEHFPAGVGMRNAGNNRHTGLRARQVMVRCVLTTRRKDNIGLFPRHQQKIRLALKASRRRSN